MCVCVCVCVCVLGCGKEEDVDWQEWGQGSLSPVLSKRDKRAAGTSAQITRQVLSWGPDLTGSRQPPRGDDERELAWGQGGAGLRPSSYQDVLQIGPLLLGCCVISGASLRSCEVSDIPVALDRKSVV